MANDKPRTWTFFSNHAHVLVVLSRQPDVLIKDLAWEVGITERAASSILADLEDEGYLTLGKHLVACVAKVPRTVCVQLSAGRHHALVAFR